MTIAVHINFTSPADDPVKNFNYHCFTKLAGKYPQDHFIFISDRPFEAGTITESNITPLVLTPAIRNNLLLHFWYNFKLPRLLNKYNADLFISKGPVCSLRTNVPQWIILHDLSFFKGKDPFTKDQSSYLRRYLARFINKAKRIVLTNPFIESELIKKMPGAANKIALTGFGVSPTFTPRNLAEQEATRERFGEGMEYFLFPVTETTWPNIMTILKAFSTFKKWQRSNMRLLLFFDASQKDKQIKNLDTYKYRNEVKIIHEEKNETAAAIISSAYAAIYLPFFDRSELTGITVLKSGTPLIAADNGFSKAIYQDAALYAASNEKSIAEKMMILYKDENLRNSLVNRGSLVAAGYTWENTGNLLSPILLNNLE